MALPPGDAANMFYNDVEREESKRLIALLKAQSVGYGPALAVRTLSKAADTDGISRSFLSPITHETWRDIPSAYLITTNDQAFKFKYQIPTLDRSGITVTKTMTTGHTPWLTRPEAVKDFILSFVADLDEKRKKYPRAYG